MKHSELFTKRFKLKILTSELVGDEYLSWFSDKSTSQYIEYAKKAVTLAELKAYAQEKLDSEDALFFGIFSRESNKHIGNIKFEPINIPGHFAIMGVLVGDIDWRGKGVFTEVDEALEEPLINLGIEKIYLGVSQDNISAVNAYKKSGYEIDAHDFLNVSLKSSYTMIKVIS